MYYNFMVIIFVIFQTQPLISAIESKYQNIQKNDDGIDSSKFEKNLRNNTYYYNIIDDSITTTTASNTRDQKTDLIILKLKSNNDDSKDEKLQFANSGGKTEPNNVNGGGGGGAANGAADDDDKTLSQQVADGKYGLIHHEIFHKKIPKPGIISYDINPEVPKDNINNLGGLELDDIWLAENHLLVLAGGAFGNQSAPWKPIDNYIAPKRPVKLPPDPKIPPPFPVQLQEGGPTELIKGSNFTVPTSPFLPIFRLPPFPPPPKFRIPPPSPYNKYPNQVYAALPPGNFSNLPPPEIPLIRPLYGPNSGLRQPPSIFYQPPQRPEFIQPFVNLSDSFDEDDPSLYYPPPYDFHYQIDNTTRVPAGPLVPGIILPPPPDFFSVLKNNTTTKTSSTTETLQISKYPEKTGKLLPYSWNENNNYKDNIRNSFKELKDAGKGSLETTINYEDIINEVTNPGTDSQMTFADIVENKINSPNSREGWIPIPGPKPYYITGPKKPIKDAIIVIDTPRQTVPTPSIPKGYSYNPPSKALNQGFVNPNSLPPQNPESNLPNKPFIVTPIPHRVESNPDYYNKFYTTPNPPLYYDTTNKFSTTNDWRTTNPNKFGTTNDWKTTTTATVSPANIYHPPVVHDGGRGKQIQTTYYFYEEPPQFSPGSGEYPYRPVTITPTRYNRPISTTSTSRPKQFLHGQDFPSSSITPEYVAGPTTPITPFSKQRRPKAPPIIPIYYLAEVDNLPASRIPVNRPPAAPSTTIRPILSVHKLNNAVAFGPTSRPIFEYSYTASGYEGTNSNIHIPNPDSVPYYRQSYYQQQPQNLPIRPGTLFYSVPSLYDQTTPSTPLFDQNPYYTSEMDKYTIPMRASNFVPMRHNPISSSQRNPYRRPSAAKVTQPPTDADDYEDTIYQTENPFYAFFTREDEKYIDDNTKNYFTVFGQKIKRKPNDEDEKYSNRLNSNNRKNHPIPESSELNNEISSSNEESTTISLEGDTAVNYLNPRPTENPDAEYINTGTTSELPVEENNSVENNLVNNYYYYGPAASVGNEKYSKFKNNQPLNDEILTIKPTNSKNRNSFSNKLSSSRLTAADQTFAFNNKDPEQRRDSSNRDSVSIRTRQNKNRQTNQRRPIISSLARDTLVNYRNPRPSINPDAEYIDDDRNYSQEEESNHQKYESYRLPETKRKFYYPTASQNFQARNYYQQLEDNYSFQIDAEKPARYYKRVSNNR